MLINSTSLCHIQCVRVPLFFHMHVLTQCAYNGKKLTVKKVWVVYHLLKESGWLIVCVCETQNLPTDIPVGERFLVPSTREAKNLTGTHPNGQEFVNEQGHIPMWEFWIFCVENFLSGQSK